MPVRTFPLTGPVNLSARLGHGSLTVHCVDDLTEARVDITARPGAEELAEHITVELVGPTLTVTAPRQGGVFDVFGDMWRKNAGVDVDVTVPTGTAMKVASFTAGVRVEGRCGGADIANGAARIDLDDVGGDLRVRSGNATVTVGRIAGSVQARTGAGDIHLAEVTGDLDCVCGSGQVVVDSVRGRVRCRAGSGEARFGAVHADVDLASGSGPLTVGLPAGLTARLDLQTGSGRVTSDLPVGDRPADARNAISVRARTGSGDVLVRRAA
jgi:hypothetical protein